MYTPEDSPFEKFRNEKLKGVAMSPDVLELVAKAYEGGFIDGMQKQMQSSVDRAVNRMAEQPAQPSKPLTDELKDAFFEGFTSVITYNDTWQNSPEEAWNEYKSAHGIKEKNNG